MIHLFSLASNKKNEISQRLISFLGGRHCFYFMLGVIAGITLNLVTVPILEHPCGTSNKQLYTENLPYAWQYEDEHSNDDYQPRVVPRDPEEIAQKMASPKKVVRPRFYSSELDIKMKLLVAVLTRPSMLEDFAVVINETLGHHVDKLLFFVDYQASADVDGLPLIVLPDNEEHTQVFRMLHYLHDQYGGLYDYFFLVSGSEHHSLPYVNGRALQRALSYISVSRPMHYGMLAAPGTHYCTLSSGVVLSGAVLSGIADSMAWCVGHARVGGQDAALGRCIMHATALPCTSMVQEKPYISIPLSGQLSLATLQHALTVAWEAVPPGALPYTVTGLQHHQHLLHVHHYCLVHEVALLQRSLSHTRAVIQRARLKAPLLPHEATWPVGSPPPHRPHTRYDVIPWQTFNASHVLMPDERRNAAPLSGDLLTDVTGVVLAAASHLTNTSGGRLHLQRLRYGHYRVDPVRGADYLLSLVFRDTATGTLLDRTVQAARTITHTEFVPMPYVTENTELLLLVPVTAAQAQHALSFMDRYLKDKVAATNTALLLVLQNPPRGASDPFKSMRTVCSSAVDARVRCVSVAAPPHYSATPELHVMDQVVRKVGSSGLVLVLSPSAYVTVEALNRVRMNTIQGWQFYSPVMFGMYHHSVIEDKDQTAYANMEVKSNIGHYLVYDYTAVSFFVTDYKKARKISSSLFPIVSGSATSRRRPPRHSLSVYRLLLSFSSLHALRAPEPFLRMPYHAVHCLHAPPAAADTVTADTELSSDVSLLMGDSQADSNAAFYRYVVNHYLGPDQSTTYNWTLDDFRGNDHCLERQQSSLGTRVQLSKLLIEYDERHGRL